MAKILFLVGYILYEFGIAEVSSDIVIVEGVLFLIMFLATRSYGHGRQRTV